MHWTTVSVPDHLNQKTALCNEYSDSEKVIGKLVAEIKFWEEEENFKRP